MYKERSEIAAKCDDLRRWTVDRLRNYNWPTPTEPHLNTMAIAVVSD